MHYSWTMDWLRRGKCTSHELRKGWGNVFFVNYWLVENIYCLWAIEQMRELSIMSHVTGEHKCTIHELWTGWGDVNALVVNYRKAEEMNYLWTTDQAHQPHNYESQLMWPSANSWPLTWPTSPTFVDHSSAEILLSVKSRPMGQSIGPSQAAM
jgi:hypothetical protein